MADDSWADEEHLKLYPYCGQMKHKDPSDAATRVVNSKASTESYRWVLRVTTTNLRKNNQLSISRCAGTVITKR